MKEQKRKSQVACDCAMQLWLVPFDKTDLTVKEGFDGRRISGYQNVNDTKTVGQPLFHPFFPLSLFFYISSLAICNLLFAQKCFLSELSLFSVIILRYVCG